MNFLLWVIFGGLAGWVASLVMNDDGRWGIPGNIIIGIVGAFLGGWLADKMGMGGAPGAERPTSLRGFASAVIGAIILLLLINVVF